MRTYPDVQRHLTGRYRHNERMKPDPHIPNPKRIPLSTEELIRAGEKLFKKARQINNKYEAVIERERKPLKDQAEPPNDESKASG
jgi:hypothetical protein